MYVAHKRNPLLMTFKMNDRPLEDTANHTYLGIGINNKLSLAEHISNTISKASKVIGLLHQNLHSCSPFVKEFVISHWSDRSQNTVQVFWMPTTRIIKIGLNQFNVELQDLSEKILDAKAMSLTC